MALPQPSDIVDHGGGSRLDAAVIAIDRLMPADCRVFETIGFLFGGEHLYILAQRALVAFQREDVIGLLVHDLRGDFPLTTHRVNCYDGAFDRQHVEELGNRDDSFDFSATLTCPSTRRWRAAKAETMWIGAL